MESKKSKKPVKKAKNIANDVNEIIQEPNKIYKKCRIDYNNAKDTNDYLAVIKKLEDLTNK